MAGSEVLGVRERDEGTYYNFSYSIMDSTDGGTTWNALNTIDMGSYSHSMYLPEQTKPHLFAFDRRHAWQAYADNRKLLRIGEP